VTEGLTLYVARGCTYCDTVRAAARDLGVELPERDVSRDAAAREALHAATGRTRVPVLRIEEPDGATWLPESGDIVEVLYDRLGDGRRPPVLARPAVDRGLRILMWSLLVAGGVASGDARVGLWTAACATAGLRSGAMALRTRRWQHAAIAAVFLLGSVAIPLQAAGVAIGEYWPLAAIVAAVLIVASTLRRSHQA